MSQAKEYRRLILEAIEDMEFLATTFNTEKGEETKKAFKRDRKKLV